MQNQGEDQNNKVDGGMDVRRVHGVKDIHKNNHIKELERSERQQAIFGYPALAPDHPTFVVYVTRLR
jgi:hypothetical protein